jgi:hypothetical protein
MIPRIRGSPEKRLINGPLKARSRTIVAMAHITAVFKHMAPYSLAT